MTDKEQVQLLVQSMQEQKKERDLEGIYAWMQIELAYHSSRMEDGGLTRKQVASIFKTGTIVPDDNILHIKDIEEITGHFRMFDEMLQTLDNSLSNNLIKKYHLCLKSGVTQDSRFGKKAGEYHKKDEYEDFQCEEVQTKMDDLIRGYNDKDRHTLEDIVRLYVQYLNIGPFLDGNHRISRMIVFKECLRNDMIPCLIHVGNQALYHQALQKAESQCDMRDLTDLFKQEQVNMKHELQKLGRK